MSSNNDNMEITDDDFGGIFSLTQTDVITINTQELAKYFND